MTDNELNEYKEDVENVFGDCTVLTSNVSGTMTNASKTGDRDAYKGIAWIDYWRAMTGNHSATLYCSSCGKEITNNPSLAQYLKFSKGNDSPDKHKACGGHIWVTTGANDTFTGGRYITPLCPQCNDQRGKSIAMRRGITLCKEIGAKKN